MLTIFQQFGGLPVTLDADQRGSARLIQNDQMVEESDPRAESLIGRLPVALEDLALGQMVAGM